MLDLKRENRNSIIKKKISLKIVTYYPDDFCCSKYLDRAGLCCSYIGFISFSNRMFVVEEY